MYKHIKSLKFMIYVNDISSFTALQYIHPPKFSLRMTLKSRNM
jgi:hypothetical protein